MADPNRPQSEDDEFFVGYFPTPPGLTRTSLAIAVLSILLGGGVAAATSLLQRAPGEAHQRAAEISGRLLAEPYGMVRYVDDADRVRHVLLVRGGKRGAPAEARESLDGQGVTVAGLLLERDGGQLLELHGAVEAEPLDAALGARLDAVETEALGEVTLEGEIVDSKCYLGRMRPGGGRTHRACAQLCIAGNIPPLLVTHDASGHATTYLLATDGNRSVSRAILPWVAEPVRVRGALSRMADLLVLRVDPETIERL